MPSEKLEKSSKIVMKKFKMNTNDMAQNDSQADLVRDEPEEQADRGFADVKFKEWVAVFVLCYVNLINYMDRFTVAGVLPDIQQDFKIDNDKGGLLQTVFIISYMLFAPIFGYLGDRYSRKWIMAAGVSLWSVTTLCGSFMGDYWWFLVFRAMVGIGEASYSTIAPTIISDLFVGDLRSKMLAMFYFAIPVGSGLGYIVGAETAKVAGQRWEWGLRVTPVMGLVAVLLIIFVLKDPTRGESECSGHMEPTPWCDDVKDIVQNRSFVFSTAGFTCVAFVAGALSWWGPKFIEMGFKLQGENVDTGSTSFVFGAITMVAGLVGVSMGAFLGQWLKPTFPRIDPILCAIGLFLSAPILFATTYVVTRNTLSSYVLLFFGQVALNLNWAIVCDILLYVVLPTRRSTAEGFQLLVSHALGDAISPYVVGVLSDGLARSTWLSPLDEDERHFKSLQYALFTTCFVEVIGGLFFLITAFYIVQDKRKVDEAVHAGNSRQLLVNNTESDMCVS